MISKIESRDVPIDKIFSKEYLTNESSVSAKHYAGVHILNAPYHIDREYAYLIPKGMEDRIFVGTIVIVPFGIGNRNVAAIVSSLLEDAKYSNIKEIIGLTPGNLCIGEELYGICEFLKERCFCTIGEASKAVIPSGFSVRINVFYKCSGKVYRNALNDEAVKIMEYISQNGEVKESELKVKFDETARCLRALCQKEYLIRFTKADCRINSKSNKYIRLQLSESELASLNETNKCKNFTPKQLAAIYELEKNPFTPKEEFMELSGVSASVIRELSLKKAIEICSLPVERNPYADIKYSSKDFNLSQSQKNAFDKLYALYKDNSPKAALLHGVTGSGKTNVIQKLVDECVKDEKGAIVLVPEIALTSQAVGIFAGRYGKKVAVLHSGLSAGERLDAWKRINCGDANVVLGTRSAIFAPVKNLGLIVIDEEQEASFKSEMTPRYHARDVARYRCSQTGAMMLLCSATPSVESYHKAKEGIYTLVQLTERFGNAVLPQVDICDLRDDCGDFPIPINEDGAETKISQKILGDKLLYEIQKNLENGEQSVLFIGRRGYQSFMSCRKCGFVPQCPHCSVALTYHKYGFSGKGKMVCHYCGWIEDVPNVCPACGSEHISALGTGTQMLEEQLKIYFPQAEILRMDTDTTNGKFSHDSIINSFKNGEADILLGTQMVTKGHDFPNVSLVGVINADSSLHFPDFRANERTFSLMTQVVGRAGRGEISGRALIQTYSPEHEVLTLAKEQNYESFFQGEIDFRKAGHYPPFCDIVTITFTSTSEAGVRIAVRAFEKDMRDAFETKYSGYKLTMYGPFEATVFKVAGRYRMRYIIKTAVGKLLRKFLSELYANFCENATDDNTMTIDVNPTDI